VLPIAVTRVLEVPSRLGGGLLIYASTGPTTQLWRTKSWLDRLEPLAEVWGHVADIVPGFDRLYARLDNGDFKAIDAQSGGQLPLEPLPRATRIGQIAFADAWRAIAIVDFRGAVATFDAGASWRSVPLAGRSVTDLWVREGDFVLESQRDRWLLGPSGELTKDDAPPDRGAAAASPGDTATTAPGAPRSRDLLALTEGYGIARRPLRAAIEDGWPVASDRREDSAIVAQAGALYRIGLTTGSILEWRADAFRADDAGCHAIALDRSFGFVCAAQAGGTVLYAFEPPFGVREVARYERARVVVPSGNGAGIVRGGCERGGSREPSEKDAFCFFWPSGVKREIRLPAALHGSGETRPVALRDGRAAFVLSRNEAGVPALLLAREEGWSSLPLAAAGSDVLLRQASWLEGVEEREPGVLSAWILLGAELRGVRIHLDGKVEVARTGASVERTSLAGRYALNWGTVGRGAETTNGGMSWTPADLPASELPQQQRAVAACGGVGCAHQGWLRIGWGATGVGGVPDLAAAPAPKPSRVALLPPRGISLRCEPTGEIAGSAPGTRSVPSPSRGSTSASGSGLPSLSLLPPAGGRVSAMLLPLRPGAPSTGGSGSAPGEWTAFRASAPPALQPGEVGLEAGTDPPVIMQARVYTWGPRGVRWMRSARVQARFDDRFELYGTRSTALTGAFWPDEERAADALGLVPAHTVNWAALLDPSGQAAILFAQQGAGRADLYGAAQGEALVPWRSADGAPLPVPASFVRLGPTWFFLASTMASSAWAIYVYRVDGGVVRRLARLPRVAAPAGEFAPKLMRRAGADGVGILVQGAPGFDQTIRDWYVLPLDPSTGDVDEPVRLVGSDLEGQVPPPCPADLDAWMVNTDLALSPAVQIVGPPLASLSTIELRLGLGPGSVCIDAMAARAEGLLSPSTTTSPAGFPTAALPLTMAATDGSSGRRWLLRCGAP
jgi:hypothetical protein